MAEEADVAEPEHERDPVPVGADVLTISARDRAAQAVEAIDLFTRGMQGKDGFRARNGEVGRREGEMGGEKEEGMGERRE